MFYEHLRGEGGGGAIDLVIHACRCTVPEALGFFSELPCRDRFPADRHPKPPCPDRHWPAIQSYLVEQRGLADVLVALCRDLGLLYADRHGNAVFVRRNAAGEALGAESLAGRGATPPRADRRRRARRLLDVVGTRLAELRHPRQERNRRPVGPLPPPRPGRAQGMRRGLNRRRHRKPPRMDRGLEPGRIFCAYDATRQGDDAAARLIRNDSRVVRLRPALDGLDWNDMLMRDRAGEPLQIDDRPLD